MKEGIGLRETLEFIEYLRTKEDVMIESQILHERSMFNLYKLDMSAYAAKLLDMIKHAGSAAAAYRAVAHDTARQNSLWKTFPEGGYMFREDFDEYLSDHPDALLDKAIKKWYSNGKLASRALFREYFPTEYVRFSMRLCDDDTERYAVAKKSLAGAYNYNRYLLDKVHRAVENPQNKITRSVTIGFNGDETGRDASELIPIGKLICEQYGIECVYIADYTNDEIIHVRKIK